MPQRPCARRAGFLAAILAAALPALAAASVIPIEPFTGTAAEDFNEFTNTVAVQSLAVFGGSARLTNQSVGGAIKVEFSSSLNGVLEVPRSGMMGGQLGIADWTFDQPVTQFGGYFANNSGASDATVSFYDSQGGLIESLVAHVPFARLTWTWNGWQSDVPFQRVEVVGNGLIHGFIWYDDMAVTYVPEPATAIAMLAMFAMAHPSATARRRRLLTTA